MTPVPEDDSIPVQISETVVRGTIKPTYPVIQYPHTPSSGGDAIANGFVYRGKAIPVLTGKLVFGDITTGRLWFAELSDVLAADDGNPATMAPIREFEPTLRGIVERAYGARGGRGQTMPGVARVSGQGRVDVRLAVDNEGELYVLTKTDGMIRQVVGVSSPTANARSTAPTPAPNPGAANPASAGQGAGALKNPVAPTPESLAAGKRIYDSNCSACHGNMAQGAVRAGTVISIIEEQNGRQPPDLTDDQWDHGSSDGDIFTAIKRGLPPTMMPGFDGGIPDNDIWSIVNYLRSLRAAEVRETKLCRAVRPTECCGCRHERRLRVRSQRFVKLVRSAIVVGVSLAGVLSAAGTVMAQALKDVRRPTRPSC